MALAVAKGIRQTLGRGSEEGAAKVGIKWPNDIVVDGKKVCGILTEMSMEQAYIHHIVIGVGASMCARPEFGGSRARGSGQSRNRADPDIPQPADRGHHGSF